MDYKLKRYKVLRSVGLPRTRADRSENVLVISSSLKNGWTWHAAQFAIPFKDASPAQIAGYESHLQRHPNVLPYSSDFNSDLPGENRN